jgi:hypothetical protein
MLRTTALALLCAAGPSLASAQASWGAPDGDALDYEQQKALREHFETHDKIRDFGSKPLELLGESKLTKFFSRYGDALLVIRISGDFANNQGDQAVLKLMEEGTKKFMEKFFPNTMKAVSWYSWAKTGMELFKAFVFDPALEGMNLDIYTKARRAGDPPEQAFTFIRAFGHMRSMALARLRAEYGDAIFEKDSKDALLPRWEDRLHRFANAWFESEYQKRELEEARQALLAEAGRAQAALPPLDDELLRMLRARATEEEHRQPPPKPAGGSGSAGAGGETRPREDVRSDVDAPSVACRGLLAAADAAIRGEDVAGATAALAKAEGACAETASAYATLASFRGALAAIERRAEQQRRAAQLCAQVAADITACRFRQALVILDGLGALPWAPCTARRAEVERLLAQEAETVRLLGLATTATRTSLRQTRALLAQALARAPACMAGDIRKASELLDQNAAWQELLAETPEAGTQPPTPAPSPTVPDWLGRAAPPPPPPGRVAGAPPSWLASPSPSPSPSAGGEGTPSPSVPAWVGGSAAAGSGKRPDEALDEARRILRDEHRDERARRQRDEDERRRQEQLRREAQERLEMEERIAAQRRRAAEDEEERRQRATQARAEAEDERRSERNRARAASVMEALNGALAQAVEAQKDRRPAAASPPQARAPVPPPPPRTDATSAPSADEAKRACVECVNALISGSCYVRTATLAGWGLCLTCSADGGVDPANRFIEKNRCPMCANVSWSLCDFRPAPKGCVPNCCSR